MSNQIQSANAFTLAEIIVVITLMAILLVLGAGIFLSNNRFYEKQTGELAADSALRLAAGSIDEYGRAAVSLISTYDYASQTYLTGAQVVILELPSLSAAGDIISNTFDHVIIGVLPGEPGKLQLIVDPDLESKRLPHLVMLTDKLSDLSFSYDNGDLAFATKVDYQIEITSPGRSPVVKQVTGAVKLRNK